MTQFIQMVREIRAMGDILGTGIQLKLQKWSSVGTEKNKWEYQLVSFERDFGFKH